MAFAAAAATAEAARVTVAYQATEGAGKTGLHLRCRTTAMNSTAHMEMNQPWRPAEAIGKRATRVTGHTIFAACLMPASLVGGETLPPGCQGTLFLSSGLLEAEAVASRAAAAAAAAYVKCVAL